MKKIVIILFGIIAAIALFIGSIFLMTSGMASVANDFFAHTKAGETDEAWALLSKEFQESTSSEELNTFLAGKGLTDVVETTWNSRAFKNSLGEIKGTAKTGSGSEIPLEVDFSKEDDGWRIRYIGLNVDGLSKNRAGTTPEKPSEADQIALVEESLTAFGESVTAKDFSGFVNHISETWRSQGVTAEQLNQAFAAFIDNEIDILPAIDGLAPAFDGEPTVADDGIMTISGHYPSTPVQVQFKLGYIKEGNSWKVIRTSVTLK